MTDTTQIENAATAHEAQIADFEPTDAMLRAKTNFWNAAGGMEATAVNMTVAIQLSGTTSVRNWWGQPGFKEWFTGRNEWRNRVEYLAMRGLDVAEQLLHDRRTTPASKVQLIKLFAELADKMPSKTKEVKFIDAGVANMDEKQLDAFIKKHSQLVASTEETNDGEEADNA